MAEDCISVLHADTGIPGPVRPKVPIGRMLTTVVQTSYEEFAENYDVTVDVYEVIEQS